MEYTIEKLEKMQEGRSTLDKLAHTAAMAEDWRLRVACANLLAYGWTTIHLDPTDHTEQQAQEYERAKYLDNLGLERTYGRDERDVYRYHFDREESESMSITQAAEALGVSRQRVHVMLQNGQLEGHKVGNAWCVNRQSVNSRIK